nr:immunoglobulin heavy chain junction region [Macaca mulatta]MOV87665.1 immunoglobulin heavy chain junction region [Macaca mulatta]MOV87963.1 immunoglobulin heavy chain junction region [Macaca mulatta]MOV88065.1 immunoglobulin heavy chain junction region [Macaca mulatta]MOV88121.1 immunoglobulin heavy chain junction region [Macaca mulatta]
CAKKEDDFDFW